MILKLSCVLAMDQKVPGGARTCSPKITHFASSRGPRDSTDRYELRTFSKVLIKVVFFSAQLCERLDFHRDVLTKIDQFCVLARAKGLNRHV